MTALENHPRVDPTVDSSPGLSVRRLVRAEWTKVSTLTSSWIVFGLMLAMTLLGAASLSKSAFSNPASARAGGAHAIASILSQMPLVTGLFVVVLSVLAVTREYSSGESFSTYVASPNRLMVLAAKTVVAVGLAIVVAVSSCVCSWAVAQALLDKTGLRVWLLAPPVVQAVAQTTAWLVVIAVVSVMIATVVRHSALALSLMFTLLTVVPVAASYLPISVGRVCLTAVRGTLADLIAGSVSPGILPLALVVLSAWLIIPSVAASLSLRRRDVS